MDDAVTIQAAQELEVGVPERKSVLLQSDSAPPESTGIGNSRLGILILLAAETMLFGGFLAAFVVLGGRGNSVPHATGTAGGWWISFAVVSISLLTSEFSRRYFEGGNRLIAQLGANLALLGGIAWLAISSDSIIGLGGGSLNTLSSLAPAEGCRLILQTLLAAHVVLTSILTGVAIVAILRSAERAGEYIVRGEMLWGFTIVVQAGIGLLAALGS